MAVGKEAILALAQRFWKRDSYNNEYFEAEAFYYAAIQQYKDSIASLVGESAGYLRITEKAMVFMPLCNVKDGERFYTLDQLIASRKGLEEEIERLKAERDAAWSVNPTNSEQLLRKQLAAAQAENERLQRMVIECRSSVKFDLLHYEKKARAYGNIGAEGAQSHAVSEAEAQRLQALMDKIDAVSPATDTSALEAMVRKAVQKATSGYVEEIIFLKAEVERLRNVKMARFNNEDCWIYQGDGSDHFKSLACPVVTYPETLEAMVQKAGEVMRERCAVECGCFYADLDDKVAALRAIPGVKLEDLK